MLPSFLSFWVPCSQAIKFANQAILPEQTFSRLSGPRRPEHFLNQKGENDAEHHIKHFFMMTASFALAVVLLGGVKASAASVEVTTEQGDFTISYGGSGYNKYEAPTVTGYKGSESDVTLPTTATIKGEEQAITILGSAFAKNAGITSVTIPEGYTKIEGSALEGCTGLTTVTIPGSLTQVGPNAFKGCTKLTAVTFAENQEGTLKFMKRIIIGHILIILSETSSTLQVERSC